MRHTARDPKTGKFISTQRRIKIWMGRETAREFHRLMLEELDKWAVRIQRKSKKCDTIQEIPKQEDLLKRDFIGKSREEITSAFRSIFSQVYKNKKGPD